MSSTIHFPNGCLQVGRLIGSAPGDLRLSANFSVLSSSSRPIRAELASRPIRAEEVFMPGPG
jgi:hypothetical protein